MHNILKEISERAILLNEFEFHDANAQTKWLGTDAANKNEIAKTEKRLQIKLPDDYINFISSTNGFPAVSNIGVTFLPIEKIDYLKNLDISLIEIWSEFEELKEISLALENSILIGGLEEEQSFLLIPPYGKHKKWRYWYFAAWLPGEQPYKSLNGYFQKELKLLKKATKGLKIPKPKPVIDYTLRDYIFQCEWEKALLLSEELFSNQIVYPYCDSLLDLLKLYLICSSKMNMYDEAEKYFQQLITNTGLEINENDILPAFKNAANQKKPIATRLDNYQYYPKDKNITSRELEQQISEFRKDLVKPNNSPDRVNYELYFLFEYGDSEDFIKKYEVNIELVSFEQHLRAASIYSLSNKKIQSKESVIQYWNQMFKYRPFEPFFNSNILETMDEDFLKNAYFKYQ